MKKYVSILLITLILLPFFWTNVNATWDNDYFVVTAYYSPLSNQKYYLTGNYESEKRLNGQGIRWASGKAVFSWMLAAPKNYKFWTKIYLEWLWIWEVSDRWWAIVNAWNRWYSYDRIDIWVWYGDEWLRRALYWGKRTIKWSLISNNSRITLDYKTIAAPFWATKWLKQIPNIFSTWIWVKSNSELVKKLQKFLKEINIYNWDIDWIYSNEIIDLIYDFQIENHIIKVWEYYWAWYWWKSTRATYLKKYLNWEFDINKEWNNKDNVINVEKEEENIEIVKKEINLELFYSAVNTVEKNKELQKVLIELGLYEWELTWVYKDLIDTIYDYQLSKWIVTWIYSLWAGSFWPKTRASLKVTYSEYLENKEQIEFDRVEKEEEIKKEKERKKDLEEKYKTLEELSLKKAEEKLKFIWTPKFGEVSHWVRELQVILKELGYFEYKDTAIYWNITKQSIINYQLDKKLIFSNMELWAGLVWPKTRETLKNDLKEQFMNQMIIVNQKENTIISI